MSKILKYAINYYYGESITCKIMRFFFPSGPHPGFALAADAIPAYEENTTAVTGTSYENPLEDGFLWGAAPKHRRSREKRMTRKFGGDRGHKKMLPVLKLLTCDNCGHVHEPGRLCPNCYAKNKEITNAMQEAMKETQGLNPVEHEVYPVFQGENFNTDNEFFEGKRIVEVPKTRPQWFSQNLTQKSNVTTSDSTTVTVKSSLG